MTSDSNEVEKLRAENARLLALLDAHGIDARPPLPKPVASPQPEPSRLSTDEKVVLFRRLFQGRIDTYPIRWESKAGKSGYSPACANEWRPGVCEKPRIKCSDCGNRLLIPLSDQIIYDHLAGRHTIGVYPLLANDTCRFLAVDFDDTDWREDAQAFRSSCRDWVCRRRSRSRVPATGHTYGFSSSPLYPPAMRDAWVPRSSVTRAQGRGN